MEPPTVEALRVEPDGADWLFVFAHGAGAGPRHPFMEAMATALAARRVATWRFPFPYMAAGRKPPDRAPVLVAAVREACAQAQRAGLRLVAGGKSMGGRMTSLALAEPPGLDVEACVFLGFPLHPARRPAAERAAHLPNVRVPMLFVQGTADALAERAWLEPVLRGLPNAEVRWIEGADHTFELPARMRTPERTIDGLAAIVAEWLRAR